MALSLASGVRTALMGRAAALGVIGKPLSIYTLGLCRAVGVRTLATQRTAKGIANQKPIKLYPKGSGMVVYKYDVPGGAAPKTDGLKDWCGGGDGGVL